MPVSFAPDLSLMRKHYYRLSRETHPDHHSGVHLDEMDENLTKSGDINAAYAVLSDEQQRIKYILENFGLLGKDDVSPIDPEFLMEMMDVNEALEELQFSFDMDNYQRLLADIAEKQNILRAELEQSILDFENQKDTESALNKIKDIYLKSKYLLRIRENITTFATSSKEEHF